MDRAYVNMDEGMAVCCWDAPSKEALQELFSKTGSAFETITEVEEHTTETFVA
jgi:hypothetical protein